MLNMKLWDDAKTGKPWQQSVVRIAYLHRGPTRALQLTPLVLPTAMQMSAGYEVLFVSQFTLYAQTHKGNRPDFSKAMAPKEAKPMYEAFLTRARGDYHEDRVKDGEFGAHMLVDIANDGHRLSACPGPPTLERSRTWETHAVGDLSSPNETVATLTVPVSTFFGREIHLSVKTEFGTAPSACW